MNATIMNISLEDGGLYSCSGFSIDLRVTEVGFSKLNNNFPHWYPMVTLQMLYSYSAVILQLPTVTLQLPYSYLLSS